MPIPIWMSVNDLVLVQGMRDTKLALSRWNEHPLAVLRPWAALSSLIALGLLLAVYVIAAATPADATHYVIPGVTREATFTDYGHVLFRNSLVLAACRDGCTRRPARSRSASSSAPRSSR